MRYHNIIHLSDLHLQGDGATSRFNQDLLIDGLVKDLSLLCDTPQQPDCIIFSGDLVQSADEGCYNDAKTILSAIADAAGLTDNQVFIVPGNHDASRQVIGPEIPRLQKFRNSVHEIDKINGLAKDQAFITYASSVFSNYEKSMGGYGEVYRKSANLFCSNYFIDEMNTAIICINTATLSGAGLTSDIDDSGKLTFPERSLVEAIKSIPKGAKKILVGHHPLNEMSEATQNYLRTLLLKDIDLYLFGHMHRAAPEHVLAPAGNCLFLQSGSLYASRDWWNGYSIISTCVDSHHVKVAYRKWQEERREFGVASELNDAGTIYSSPQSETHWGTIIPRVSDKVMEHWRQQSFVPFITDILCEDGPDQINDVFVEPEFERDIYVETGESIEKAAKPEQLTFDETINIKKNLVISADAESGKTTLIRRWALSLAKRKYRVIDWSLPIVIRFAEIKRYISQFEALLKSRAPDLPGGVSIKSLLDAGQVTLLIDDVELKDGNRLAVLTELMNKYTNSRYVLLTSTPYLQGAGIAPVIAPGVQFDHIRLKPLRKSQILQLIEYRGTTDPIRADQLLQRMTQEAASLNVPITPVTGTFLIQIYTEDNGKPLINRANLIERYVEIILEKFAPEEILPSTFDYHNKRDVLSFIAAHMCRVGIYEMSSADLIALVDGYLKRFGLRFSSVDIVEYFIRARILSKDSDMVSFRMSAFLSYFAAVRMSEDLDFKAFVFEEDRYISFRNEICFYAALSRKDAEWLKELHSRFKLTSDAVWNGAPPEIRDATLLDTFVPLGTDAEEEDVFALERQIFEAPLTEEERRAVLDGEDEGFKPFSQNVVRTYPKNDPPAKWLSQLTLLSEMLKNMELIDTEEKEIVLKDVIKGWLQFTCMTMGVVPALARDRKMSFGGIEYRIIYPEKMPTGEIARRLMSYLPISSAKFAAHSLGTEKLRSQLESGVGSDASVVSPSTQFMRASILAQIGIDGLDELMQSLSYSLSGHRYLQEAFVRQLAEIVVRFRLPAGELAKVKLLAANTIVDLENPKESKRVIRRNEVIRNLTSSRLLVQAGDKDSLRRNGKRK